MYMGNLCLDGEWERVRGMYGIHVHMDMGDNLDKGDSGR